MQTIYIDNNLSLPPSLISNNTPPEACTPAKLLPFQQYRKHYRTDDTLERANKPINATVKTSVAGGQAQKIMAIGNEKLKGNRQEWFISDTYLALVTGQKDRQNRNVISQINGTKFHIKRDRKRKGYVLAKLETENISWQYIAKSESPQPQETIGLEPMPYKNNSSKRTRSMRAHESNLLLDSKIIMPSSDADNIADASVEKIVAVAIDISVDPKVVVIQKLNNFPPNQRKKTTNAEKKARILKFRQYQKPKTLADMHPLLDQAMYDELRSESGRDFCNTFIEQTVLKMANKPDVKPTFNYRKGFIAYMGAVLKWELHDAVKTNNINFHYKQNKSSAEIAEYASISDRDNYLSGVETRAYTHRTDESQYRAKLVGTMKPWQAYNFLSNLKVVRKVGDMLELHIAKQVELTPYSLEMVLQEASAIGGYCGVEKLEFVI